MAHPFEIELEIEVPTRGTEDAWWSWLDRTFA